jgi:Ca2+-binding EF-hand superfamily protein
MKGISDPLLLEQLYITFDKDNNGLIDFSEFFIGLTSFQNEKNNDEFYKCNFLI